MSRSIAIYGGSFDPPGFHHVQVATEIAKHFKEIWVVPCGRRDDKRPSAVNNGHRAAMIELAFAGISNATVDLTDLTYRTFTPTFEVDARYAAFGENRWHVIGSDLIQPGGDQKTPIHHWIRGEEIWKTFSFAVMARPGYPFAKSYLPPNALVFGSGAQCSSTEIRAKILNKLPFEHLVTSDVANYINQKGLYRR